MKKIFTFIAIFMIATCLTACSTPDDGVFKPDTNDNSQFEQTDKSDNKKSDTETKKDDSKADKNPSESKSDNKKPDSNSSSDKHANKPSSGNNGSASKPNSNKPADKPSKPNGNTGSNKPSNGSSNSSNSSTSKPSQSTEKPAETKPSQPAHQHTWVDHTATKTVTEYIHHDAVYQDVTTPAVTQKQIQCLGCGKWFASAADLDNHAFAVQIGQESGNPSRCGSTSYDAEREVVITPAKTEHKLVKDAWDEPVQKTETYVDYQECTGCHEHRQK